MEQDKLHIPLTEKIKSVPGFFGFHFNEMPKYKVAKADGDIELRIYEPMLLARITLMGDYESAKEKCFNALAGFIFGANYEKKELAMTSPVLLETKKVDSDLTMSFVLPSEVTAATAPVPENKSVVLQQLPIQTWASIKFSGPCEPVDIYKNSEELKSWLKLNNFEVDMTSLRVAQYDSPATISSLRRNEVQILIYK